MKNADTLEIFLTATPGMEPILIEEVREKGFKSANLEIGGVTVRGGWEDVWRANLELRGASRVLIRLGTFTALHLAQLDKKARKFPWEDTLRKDVPVRVEVTCKKSRIYHDKAAAERIETALKETLGAEISAEAEVCVKVRIFKDLCTVSIDTSGEALHKRGHKEAVNKAPMRENLAALLLRKCGFDGSEPVVDPMCGSGTFVIEAAEMALGLNPGRSRRFAFEQLVSFDPEAWQEMQRSNEVRKSDVRFYGFDRDKGAVSMSTANAERAGVTSHTEFLRQAISDLKAPVGPTGLVIINPPYGIRIGEVKRLTSLYQSLGTALSKNFAGWRVGMVTNNEALAQATGLKFKKKKVSFSHGGIPVKLYISNAL